MSEPVDFVNRKRLPRIQHENGKKLCAKCRQWVLETEFSIDNATWDRLRPDCKICASTKRKITAHLRGVRPHDALRTPYNVQGQKWCKKCNSWKVPEQFASDCSKWDGRAVRCKECDAIAHRMERKMYPKQVRRRAREYQTKRYKYNIQYRLRVTCKNRIWWALKGIADKSAHTEELIGCSMKQLKQHLEKQFQPGMSWTNYGPTGWHVGHIRDCCSFDLTDPKQQFECFNFSNLKPQWAKDNWSKPRDNKE